MGGSVKVDATITPPAEVDPNSVVSSLADSNALATAVITKTSAVPGIEKVSSGSLSCIGVTKATLSSSSSAVPSEEDEDFTSGADYRDCTSAQKAIFLAIVTLVANSPYAQV